MVFFFSFLFVIIYCECMKVKMNADLGVCICIFSEIILGFRRRLLQMKGSKSRNSDDRRRYQRALHFSFCDELMKRIVTIVGTVSSNKRMGLESLWRFCDRPGNGDRRSMIGVKRRRCRLISKASHIGYYSLTTLVNIDDMLCDRTAQVVILLCIVIRHVIWWVLWICSKVSFD